jgi:hypothetical protein
MYTSTAPTDYRFATLMQDPYYRLSIACHNVSYNQPPHTGFLPGCGHEATGEGGYSGEEK